MSPNLYDLLDVPEDASADEIRAAWKASIADLEPTDRRFRAFNDAAAVLLDEDKRAAYDAELAAARAAEEPDVEEPEAAEPDEPVEAAEPVAPVVAEAAEGEPAEEAAAADAPAEQRADAVPAAGPPTWALAVTAAFAVLCVALLVVVLSWPGSRGEDPPSEQEERAAAAEVAGERAEDVAAALVPEVFSYDYRSLDADLERARVHLTEDFAAERAELIADIRDQVEREKVVVTAAVSGTGLTRISPDGQLAEVVVYLEQDSQKGSEEPRTLRMWANLTLVRDGEGWLLDDVCTERDCA